MSRYASPVLISLAVLLLCPTEVPASTPYLVTVIDRDPWLGSGAIEYSVMVDPGDTTTFCVWVDPSSGADMLDGGFDFLISYDDAVMALLSADRGADLHPDWEYFTYRTDATASCGSCPGALVRAVGLADMNDGVTPPNEAFDLAGCVVELTFATSADPAHQGSCNSLDFYAIDCGDNVIAPYPGDSIFTPTSGIYHDVNYDSLACTDEHPYIEFTSGELCIAGEQQPDTLPDPYNVALIDNDAWVTSDSFIIAIHLDPGEEGTYCLWVDPGYSGSDAEGGFDMLIGYDPGAMTLESVVPGSDLHPEWEHFVYTTVPGAGCPGCPGAMVRIIGLADLGGAPPPDEAFNLSGCIAELTFTATNDPEYDDGSCNEVVFFSDECGDNAITTRGGDTLFLPGAGTFESPGYPDCSASGFEVIGYAGADLCIGTPIQPPDSLEAPYAIKVVDRDAWVNQGVPQSYSMSDLGDAASACVWVDPASGAGGEEAGFDLLVAYDDQALTVTDVRPGADLHPEWEYFTHRLNSAADSCPILPQGLIRLVGLADLANGSPPPDEAYSLSGCVVEIDFLVSSDPQYAGTCLPIEFAAFDCGDNSISNRAGDSLIIPLSGVQSCGGWDPGACNFEGTGVLQGIDFAPGAICISSELAGGDLNLNGIANEIGDLVLYTNFFLYGPKVFDPPFQGIQVGESEINCDSLTLTTFDAAFLWDIIVGDKQPCQFVGPAPAGSSRGASATGPDVSFVDSMRVVSTAALAGATFDLDIFLHNVDPLRNFNFRLIYDSEVLEPVLGDSIDFPGGRVATIATPTQLRGDPLGSLGGSVTEPGVLVVYGNINFSPPDDLMPGTGPILRMSWRTLPGVDPQISVIRFENDPAHPNSYNTITDVNAEIWKRPILVDGSVNVGGVACYCPSQGDINADGFRTSIDLSMLIDCLFAGAPVPHDPTCPFERIDVNCSGFGDALDLADFIDHLFAGQPGPCDPCYK